MKLSWNDVDLLVAKLAEDLKDAPVTSIWGMPRGGLVPSVMLSHRLDLPMYGRIDETTLIIDDIRDSGGTLARFKHFYTATLLIRRGTKFVPDFYAKEIIGDQWIEFPWEA